MFHGSESSFCGLFAPGNESADERKGLDSPVLGTLSALEAFFCDDALYKVTFTLHYIGLQQYQSVAVILKYFVSSSVYWYGSLAGLNPYRPGATRQCTPRKATCNLWGVKRKNVRLCTRCDMTGHRVITSLENLEMSGNLTAVREVSGILLKIRKMSGKSCLKLFIVSCIFVSIQVYSRSLFFVKY